MYGYVVDDFARFAQVCKLGQHPILHHRKGYLRFVLSSQSSAHYAHLLFEIETRNSGVQKSKLVCAAHAEIKLH